MFQYEKVIFLGDTDATGVLHFPAQFKWAGEAFEVYLYERGLFLKHSPEFLLPVVHAEGDYHQPLSVGDRVTIELSLKKVGTTSFTLFSRIMKGEALVGEVTTVHVVVDALSGQSKPVPEEFLQGLRPRSGQTL